MFVYYYKLPGKLEQYLITVINNYENSIKF